MCRIRQYLFIACLTFANLQLPAVTLTDTQGRSIEVDIIEVGTDSVEVRRSDGYKFDIPFSNLNEKSREILKAFSKAPEAKFDIDLLNQILGLDLWNDADLWDYGNTTFWLAAVEDEYIALRIMTPELADSWGRVETRSDATVRNAAKDNVLENEFGDVVIKNIPMVNQGPKGYCVPATMERCLRYMGIRADMYTLAMAGGTLIGGGTYVGSMIEGTSSYVRSNSRKMDSFSGKLSIKNISKYIDRGQPLIWRMTSTDAYNALSDTITRQRSQATDPEEWRDELADIVTNGPEIYQDPNRGHVCLIIGYNETTEEIAVSDSWGPKFELRWITEDEAEKVSSSEFYYIDF